MDSIQIIALAAGILLIAFKLAILAALVYLVVLAIRALRKYLRSKEVREEKKQICRSLGELLKENRLRCKMTQEFVAETLGVSRQAVSKWENGTADPSTANLIALAGLYGVAADELLKSVDNSAAPNQRKDQAKAK